MDVDVYTATMTSGLAVILLAAVSVVAGIHDISAILFLVGGLFVAGGFMPQRAIKDGHLVIGGGIRVVIKSCFWMRSQWGPL